MTILLTGSTGRVGPFLVDAFQERYVLRTLDIEANPHVSDARVGNIQDFEAVREATRGCDVVVHLAATSDEAPFIEQLVPNNVVGMWNVLESARLEGVKRVVYASSCQAVGRALRDLGPAETDRFRPNSLYGATKVLGEAMGSFYFDKHGLEFVGVRIGFFEPPDSPRFERSRQSNIYLSIRDLQDLFVRAVETPDVGFVVVSGTSKTHREALSLRTAREVLGFEPQDENHPPAPVA